MGILTIRETAGTVSVLAMFLVKLPLCSNARCKRGSFAVCEPYMGMTGSELVKCRPKHVLLLDVQVDTLVDRFCADCFGAKAAGANLVVKTLMAPR